MMTIISYGKKSKQKWKFKLFFDVHQFHRDSIFQVYRLCLRVWGVLNQIKLSFSWFWIFFRWEDVRNMNQEMCDLNWETFDVKGIYEVEMFVSHTLSFTITEFLLWNFVFIRQCRCVGAHADIVHYIYTSFCVNIEQYPMQYWPRYLFIHAHMYVTGVYNI